MYQNILVPLDCSKLAESILPYAVWLSNRVGSDITLFHACTPEHCEFIDMHQEYVSQKVEIIKRRLLYIRNGKSTQHKDKPVDVRGTLVIGYPPEEIIQYSNGNNISMILIARHGQSGIKQWAIGGVADKVIRASSVPVWLTNVPFSEKTFEMHQSIGKILVLLDGSDVAECVLPYVKALVEQQNDKSTDVILLTVFDPEINSPFLNYGAIMDYLAEVEKRFSDADLNLRHHILEGNPAREIIAHANSNLASHDLIAMTTYGWSASNGLGLGNVSEKVIKRASVPVLLIIPDKKANTVSLSL